MDYGSAISDGAIGLAVAIAVFGLIKVLLRRRAKPQVLNGELSLKDTGSIKGAFLFGCVVKNNRKEPCFITDVQIKLPNSDEITTGGRVNLYSRETDTRGHAGSTKLPVLVSGPGQIPIKVVGRAGLGPGQYPSRAIVKLKIQGRRRPITQKIEVNNRYLITCHRFK